MEEPSGARSGRLEALAAATPTSRERYVDFLRAASIVAVVFGQDITVRVRFEGGLVRVSSDQLPGSIHVRATIQEGALVLRPNDGRIPLSVRYHLPEVVPGIRYTSIRVTGSRATLTFELHDVDVPCCD